MKRKYSPSDSYRKILRSNRQKGYRRIMENSFVAYRMAWADEGLNTAACMRTVCIENPEAYQFIGKKTLIAKD